MNDTQKPTHFNNLQYDLDKINELVKQYSIPHQPDIILSLQQELQKTTPDIKKIVLTIKNDVSLASEIMQLANSMHNKTNNSKNSFSSITDSIAFLGLPKIQMLIQAKMIKDDSQYKSNLQFYKFWDSATDVAIVSHYLANKLSLGELLESEVYTLGLFRDSGIPILMQAFPNYLDLLQKANTSTEQTLVDLENESLGFNHQMVGYCLSQAWNFPWQISWAILTHHDIEPPSPNNSIQHEEKNILISIVHIGEIISNRFRKQIYCKKNNESWSDEYYQIHPYILEYLSISEYDLADLIEDIIDNMDDLLNSHHR